MENDQSVTTSTTTTTVSTSPRTQAPQISVYSSSDRQAVQVIQQALHRQPSTAAQYLQQMYAAQQQHLMLQTAALQQQHLSSTQLQSLAAVQQAGGRQSSSPTGSISQQSSVSQTSINLSPSSAAPQLMNRTQTANTSGSGITQQAMLLGNTTPTLTASQAQMYLRAQMVQNLAVRSQQLGALPAPSAQSVPLKGTCQSQPLPMSHTKAAGQGVSSKANLADSGTESSKKGESLTPPSPELRVSTVTRLQIPASTQQLIAPAPYTPMQQHQLIKQQQLTQHHSPPKAHHQLLIQHQQVPHRQTQVSEADPPQHCPPLPPQGQPPAPPQPPHCVSTQAHSQPLSSHPQGQQHTVVVSPALPRSPPASPAPPPSIIVQPQSLAPPHAHRSPVAQIGPLRQARPPRPGGPAPGPRPPPAPALTVGPRPGGGARDGVARPGAALEGAAARCPGPHPDALPGPPSASDHRRQPAGPRLAASRRAAERAGTPVVTSASASVIRSSADTLQFSSTSSPTIPAAKLKPSGAAPSSGNLPGVDNKPPQAIVKPQILTHVIEGFVIQEGLEPFPVSRSSLLTEQPVKQKVASEVPTTPPAPVQSAGEIQSNASKPLEESLDSDVDDLTGEEGMEGSDPDMLKCEFCGKMDYAHKFRRSKRFCSMSCAKRYNVGCSKRMGLFKSDKSSRWNRKPEPHVFSRRGRRANILEGASGDHFMRQMPVGFPPAEEATATSNPPLPEEAVSVAMTTRRRQNEREREMRELRMREAPNCGEALHADPTTWTVDHVWEFIYSLPGCKDIAEEFRSQEIDGQALLLLKEDHLMSAMNIKLGPALKICARINMLKES
ncbi:polyhomeotic-like protein 3 isoform X2 [Pristis pectinata]|uniref:polyhomeotic-like protein 3 isoform X2 n=1 Tax=Pristis pectinata TaxID=685728 RepID=UPI00223DA025|nr:polyhomeotic-like protein 3 isoform X2 [Pristis pectinata]